MQGTNQPTINKIHRQPISSHYNQFVGISIFPDSHMHLAFLNLTNKKKEARI